MINPQELSAARKRNKLRLQRAAARLDPARYIELTKAEATTLALSPMLTITRRIHPKMLSLRLWQCPFGRAGMIVWAHETVRWWGKDPEQARYIYADDAGWNHATAALGWRDCPPETMPKKARRFRMFISDVKRTEDGRSWLLTLERLPAVMIQRRKKAEGSEILLSDQGECNE